MIPELVTRAASVIHARICEESWDECVDEFGPCMKAATELWHGGLLAEAVR